MATIYRNTNGCYYFRLGAREARVLGTKRAYSTGTKSKRLAEEKLKQLKKVIASSDIIGRSRPASEAITLEEAYRLFLSGRKADGKPLSRNTIEMHERAFKYLYKCVSPDKLIGTYTRSDYYAFVDAMNDGGISQNSQSMYSARIVAIFNWLIAEGYLKQNPFKTVSEVVNPIKIKTQEEIQRLFDYARGKKFENILIFMYISAFRADEAINLKYEDIKSDRIEVRGKGNKDAWIPITAEMREFLSTLPKNKTGKVFDVSYDRMRDFFYRAEKKLGIRYYSHDLRKYRISMLANSGVKLFFVKNYARHSSIKTTLKYYAAVDASKMVDEIDEKLSNKSLQKSNTLGNTLRPQPTNNNHKQNKRSKNKAEKQTKTAINTKKQTQKNP